VRGEGGGGGQYSSPTNPLTWVHLPLQRRRCLRSLLRILRLLRGPALCSRLAPTALECCRAPLYPPPLYRFVPVSPSLRAFRRANCLYATSRGLRSSRRSPRSRPLSALSLPRPGGRWWLLTSMYVPCLQADSPPLCPVGFLAPPSFRSVLRDGAVLCSCALRLCYPHPTPRLWSCTSSGPKAAPS
jgi:hypothetical protein